MTYSRLHSNVFQEIDYLFNLVLLIHIKEILLTILGLGYNFIHAPTMRDVHENLFRSKKKTTNNMSQNTSQSPQLLLAFVGALIMALAQ